MLWKWSYKYDWIECGCSAGPHIPNRWAEYKISTTSHSDYMGRIQSFNNFTYWLRIRWAEYKVSTTSLTDYGLGGQNAKFVQLHLQIRWASSTNVFYLDTWVSCTHVLYLDTWVSCTHVFYLDTWVSCTHVHLFVSLVEFCFVFSLPTVDDG